MKMNAFTSKESINGQKMSIYTIKGIDEYSSGSMRYKYAWQLCRSFNSIAVPFSGGEKILVEGHSTEDVRSGNLVAIFTSSISVDSNDPAIRSGVEGILNEKIKKRMRNKGYIIERGSILPKKPDEFRLDGGEPILVFRGGVKYQVEVLRSGHIIIWLDPKVRIKQRASNLLQWMISDRSKDEVQNILHNETVYLEPYYSPGIITGIKWDQTAGSTFFDTPPDLHSRVGNDQVNISDYWRFKHRKNISNEEGPILMVQLKGRNTEIPYPPSVVYLSTKGKSMPMNVRRTFTMPSLQRIDQTEKFAKVMISDPVIINGNRIRFNLNMATDDELIQLGKLRETGVIPKPQILLGNNRATVRPSDMNRFGPYSGPRKVPVFYLLPPNTRLDVNGLHDRLNSFMMELHLGELELIGHRRVHSTGSRPTRNDYWDAARNAGFEIDKWQPTSDENIHYGKPLLISIIPFKDSETYAGGKQGAHEDNHSIQNLTESTAIDIAVKGNRYYAFNTLMQVYLKCLDSGEAPWILQNPAGGAEGTAYLGYDVSRRFDIEHGTKKEAAATISMVDCRGRSLLNKLHTSQTGETLDESTANRMVFEVSGEAHRSYQSRSEEFRRLVIFKDGIIRSNEQRNILTGVKGAINDMIEKETMPDNIEVELISVVKSGIERLYDDKGYNPSEGSFVINNDGSVIISTSSLGKRASAVTVQTTRLEPIFKAGPNELIPGTSVDSITLAKEFHDLCNLDWASLWKQPKYPIVLRLVQRLGEQYTLDIDDPSYLPL